MLKEVITCNTCAYFLVQGDGMCTCSNPAAIPFPSANDYCSKGKISHNQVEIALQTEQLLKQVYLQRRK